MVAAPPLNTMDRACDWLTEVRPDLRGALNEHGALFIRGLPIRSADDFARARDVLVEQRAAYQEKATPRSDFGDGVFSSTDLPPAQAIRLHNENSYTLTFPGVLLFCCLTAPPTGGATPVADCREVLRHIPPELVERFRTRGWALIRNYSEHISLDWRTALGADSVEEVSRYCDEHRIAWEWGPDESLRTTQRRAAIIHHPVTGEGTWFNHAAFWNEWSLDPAIRDVLVSEFGAGNLPFNTAFGDGEPLTEAEVEALNAAYAKATRRESWQVGDLMIVDNILAAHGRDPFRGDRKIVVAMGEPVAVEDCRPTVAATSGFAR
jgi:alpha-ketoglutarate-dependent taurine dioxygenase